MDEVEQIKERLDIVEIISSYLTLKKAGANLKANCPFHNEKSPSFMVSPERQTFKCFGCGEYGDVFTFIEKMEGIDFYNALKILADRAGVQLQNKSIVRGEREYKSDRKTRVFEINDWAKKLYHKILTDHPKSINARNYLEKREMSKETIKTFEIGYAPASWDLLIKFLKIKGYKVEEMFQTGLVVRNDKGDYYDRFRGRIVFPINNIMGNTIAFTSRILIDNPDQPKYINSAESPIYIKGKTIYGLDKAKMAIKEKNMAIFVEGNMDVIACHQAGFKNVVATSGTAITEDQLKILSRYTPEIAFSFDSDNAGEAAMKKAVGLALKNDINSKIIALSGPYKDADEAIKADPKNWIRAVGGAKPSLEYWIDLLIKKHPDLDISTKKQIVKEILPVIKTIFSPIEKEYYIKYLANKLSVSEKSLIATLEKTRTRDEGPKNTAVEEKKQNLSLEEKVIGLLWSKSELIPIFQDKIKKIKLEVNGLENFLKLIFEKETINPDKVQPTEKTILDQLAMAATMGIDLEDDDSVKKEILFLIKRLESDSKESLKFDFARQIQKAEESGDKDKVKALLDQFSSLIKS